MQNAVIKKFPYAKVHYSFINRGGTKFPRGFDIELRKEINEMKRLQLTEGEKEFLTKTCYYVDPAYIDFLSGYHYDPNEVSVSLDDGDLKVEIEGYWYRTIMWEVPLLAIISELFFYKRFCKEVNLKSFWDKVRENNRGKAERLVGAGVKFADFGTRRRFSYSTQYELVGNMIEFAPKNFVGTSNVHLAHHYDIKPIGTQAHEWYMFHAAKYGFKLATKMALENWVDVYGGDLGIALSDTFTSEEFFKSFDKKYARLFDGVRQDSGDPIHFALSAVEHYEKLGIDPMGKTIVFSDNLNVDKVIRLDNIFKWSCKLSYGVGTNFTNDVGETPLNIVIKMTEAKPFGDDWMPTIKLSDDDGKHTGDEDMIEFAKKSLGIKSPDKPTKEKDAVDYALIASANEAFKKVYLPEELEKKLEKRNKK